MSVSVGVHHPGPDEVSTYALGGGAEVLHLGSEVAVFLGEGEEGIKRVERMIDQLYRSRARMAGADVVELAS